MSGIYRDRQLKFLRVWKLANVLVQLLELLQRVEAMEHSCQGLISRSGQTRPTPSRGVLFAAVRLTSTVFFSVRPPK